MNFRKILWPAGTVISQVQLEMVPDLAVLITPFTSSIFCSHGAKFVSVMNEKNDSRGRCSIQLQFSVFYDLKRKREKKKEGKGKKKRERKKIPAQSIII